MMKKIIAPALTCIGIGVCLGIFFFQQYNPKEPTKQTGSEVEEKVTFIQLGVYSSKESMDTNLANLIYYTYFEEAQKFYAFGAITKNSENIEKIKGYYHNIGYDTYAKEFTIKSSAFLEVLNQYDLMLKETKDEKTIGAICNQVIAKYEELVSNDKNEGTTSE